MITNFKMFENNFNIETAMQWFRDNYTEDIITSAWDDEMLNWIDADWESDDDGSYENEYEWYIDHNNNECGDQIRDNLINDYKRAHPDEQIDVIELGEDIV